MKHFRMSTCTRNHLTYHENKTVNDRKGTKRNGYFVHTLVPKLKSGEVFYNQFGDDTLI